MMLRQLDDDLWVVEHPFRLLGLPIGARTTVVRLASGGLFLHSPGPLSVQLAQQLDAIGPVEWIVAPNKFHHLFVTENAKAYQGAQVFLAPGLPQKEKHLSYNEELGDEAPAAWAGQLEQHCIAGAAPFGEVEFFHPPTRTLIATDLSFNFPEPASLGFRLFLKANAACGRFTPSRILKMGIRDKALAKQSIERILEWDFDRVIVSHGDVLERGGKEALRAGFAYLG